MRIIFGYDFDSGCYPDALEGGKASLGVTVSGPLQLINVLETRLGLRAAEKHGAVRIAQYLNVLRQTDDGNRFYSASFKADAWSTAKQLLDLRDDIVIGGWKGDPFKVPGRRLADLTAVESIYRKSEHCNGIGERLQKVLDELQQGRACGIATINHADNLDTLPLWCQHLFLQLRNQGVEFKPINQLASIGTTDLSLLQQAMSVGKPTDLAPFKGDGSICMIKAATDWEAAEALASWLETQEKLFPKILLVAGATGAVLDDRLHDHGLPGLGSQSRSRWRAALQVLPLVISNLWMPFDPARLLELLTLPKSPISKYYGNYFINALCQHPGLDGPEWKRAWEKAREAFRNNKYGTNKTEDDFCEDLRFWLGEKRSRPEEGMSVQYIQQVCSRVADWATSRGGIDGDSLLIDSAVLARAVADAAAATGMDSIPRPQLERIIDAVIGQGLENPETQAQAAPWSCVNMPDQIWGLVDTIVWWNFTNPGIASKHQFWTEGEIISLNTSGIFLESPGRNRMREAFGWQKPVLFARKRLILFFSENAAVNNGGLHPLWDEMRHLLRIEQTDEQKLIVDASSLWQEQKPLIAGAQIKRKRQTVISQPSPQREWPIMKKELVLPDSHSVSSMETLISCPLSWVFSHIVNLSGGSIASLPDLKQIIGTLCHRIIEDMFTEQKNWVPEAAAKRSLSLFDEYVPQMAAILLHPGYELYLQRYRITTERAVKSLVEILNEARLSVMETEASREKKMPGSVQLKGKLDMILANSKGDAPFMDLKWSGSSKYRRGEMEQGLSLQLAAYSWLLSGGNINYPPGGYYMLAQQELLFTSCKMIPPEHIASDINLKDVWDNVSSAFKERIAELQNGYAIAEGIAEVPVTEPSNMTGESDSEQKEIVSAAFPLEPKCNFCAFGNLCGKGRQ